MRAAGSTALGVGRAVPTTTRRISPRDRRPRVARVLLCLFAMWALKPGGVVLAQPGVSFTQADAVASRLNCPICEGYTLRDCPLPICGQMRDEIHQMLEAGQGEEEIIDHFVVLHGPQVLNMPPARGAFLAAWILPLAVLFGGALAVWRTLAAARSRGGPGRDPRDPARSVDAGESVGAEPMARIEQLLAERDPR